jgi:hypothetical protein
MFLTHDAHSDAKKIASNAVFAYPYKYMGMAGNVEISTKKNCIIWILLFRFATRRMT